MTHESIIKLINTTINPATHHRAYTACEAITAGLYGYYFIKPGNDTRKYWKRLNDILNYGEKMKIKMQKNKGFSIDFIADAMANKILKLARSMFNAEYYKAMTDKEITQEKNGLIDINKYMNTLNDDDLKFFCSECVLYYDYMIGEEPLGEVYCKFSDKWIDLNAANLGINSSRDCLDDESWDDIFDKFSEYTEDNGKYYYYNYLSASDVANIVSSYIDPPTLIHEYLTHTVKYAPTNCDAINYTCIALHFWNLFYNYFAGLQSRLSYYMYCV